MQLNKNLWQKNMEWKDSQLWNSLKKEKSLITKEEELQEQLSNGVWKNQDPWHYWRKTLKFFKNILMVVSLLLLDTSDLKMKNSTPLFPQQKTLKMSISFTHLRIQWKATLIYPKMPLWLCGRNLMKKLTSSPENLLKKRSLNSSKPSPPQSSCLLTQLQLKLSSKKNTQQLFSSLMMTTKAISRHTKRLPLNLEKNFNSLFPSQMIALNCLADLLNTLEPHKQNYPISWLFTRKKKLKSSSFQQLLIWRKSENSFKISLEEPSQNTKNQRKFQKKMKSQWRWLLESHLTLLLFNRKKTC